MTLIVGARIGAYEIGPLLGAGGMGEVYRARDTRLQRDVALKILPESVASDPERLARFEREAQMLAALNHPHIAAIYGLEDGPGDVGHPLRALVLELVEGETLAERIAQGPVLLDEALTIARQLADALEAAHEQGIVHRDLKPSNIKVRPDGTVKVLDFGLAKLASDISNAGSKDAAYTASPLTVAPTITTPAMTQAGVIMGTAAYMSPEQAKGREADKRSDVWAFGAVFYEMLTGRRAFEGDDMSDTLASVLKIDPDWARLPADAPPALRTLVQRCLTKDPRQRVSDIAAARFVLTELGTIGPPAVASTVPGAPPANRRARWHWFVPAAVATVLTAIVVGAGAWALRPGPDAPPLVRFAFTLPEGQSFSNTGRQVLAISPDGTKLVYVANQRLYLRTIGELDTRAIAGTESDSGAFNPVFSPDGQSIAYWSNTGSVGTVLKRIPITGGAASTLADTGAPIGASWSPGGILFGVTAGRGDGGIARVPPNGGMPERLITLGTGERAHGPQMLPDGRTVLFTFTKEASLERWDHAQLVAESLLDHSRHVLVDAASDGRYLPSGHLLYAASGTMFAVPFDLGRLEKTGTPVPVVVGVARATAAQTGSAHFAVSDNGTVMYRPGPANVSSAVRGVVIGDSHGASSPLRLPTASYAHPRVSPDGHVLAVAREDGAGSDIWTYDLSGTTAAKRLTFDGNNRFPVWSADGRRVTFQSNHDGDASIWWQSPESGAAERLTKAARGEEHVPESWSRDGSRLLFAIVKGRTRTLWVLTLNGLKTERFSTIESIEPFSAGFSPDGNWVVYAHAPAGSSLYSPERGVFVEPYPARPGEKRQAPKSNIDYHPVWSPDGKSIYYVPSSPRPTVAVPITLTPSVSFGTPVELARMPRPALLSGDVRGYDVLRDGRVVSLSPGADDSAQFAGAEVRVILNWLPELLRLVPTR